ncbi:MAG: hypothetical protein KDB08_06015 [Microthrixaceae bacterium]|nr:hypothetical protein [Microthrixaceae bacterium]
MKLLVPELVPFEAQIDGVRVVVFDPTAPIPDAHLDAAALVVWGMPNERIFDVARRLRRLRWVQGLAAGSDVLLAAGFPDSAAITGGRTLHDAPVAEQALALTLAAARRLHTLVRAQLGHRWAAELGGFQPEPSPGVFTTLRGARVVVWGYGGIARTLTPHLRALGAHVTGVATTARTEGDVEVVTAAALPELFPRTDVVIMVLPATAETTGALGASLLAALPAHAWVINVGRGTTVDEDALLAALRAGSIAGAALDVTVSEPLPVSSPLWDLPNVIITPHAAGGRPLGAAALIERNARALLAGEPLHNLVRAAR